MPLLRVQTLLQHPVAVPDRSFVPHLRLRRRRRHQSLRWSFNAAVDLTYSRRLVLSTFSQAFDHSCIVHSCNVHPYHIVPMCPLLHFPQSTPPFLTVPLCPLPQIPSTPVRLYLCWSRPTHYSTQYTTPPLRDVSDMHDAVMIHAWPSCVNHNCMSLLFIVKTCNLTTHVRECRSHPLHCIVPAWLDCGLRDPLNAILPYTPCLYVL